MKAKILNEQTKLVSVAVGSNPPDDYVEMEVEKAYDGNWYVKGYAPVKPQEVKEQEVREVRSAYYEKYVDWYQSKPLLWEELSETAKELISEYRLYLKDYTKTEGWFNQNPMTYEEWLKKTHPQASENFYLNNP